MQATTTPTLRCTRCGDVLLAVPDTRLLGGREIARATASHYAAAHGGPSVPERCAG